MIFAALGLWVLAAPAEAAPSCLNPEQLRTQLGRVDAQVMVNAEPGGLRLSLMGPNQANLGTRVLDPHLSCPDLTTLAIDLLEVWSLSLGTAAPLAGSPSPRPPARRSVETRLRRRMPAPPPTPPRVDEPPPPASPSPPTVEVPLSDPTPAVDEGVEGATVDPLDFELPSSVRSPPPPAPAVVAPGRAADEVAAEPRWILLGAGAGVIAGTAALNLNTSDPSFSNPGSLLPLTLYCLGLALVAGAFSSGS